MTNILNLQDKGYIKNKFCNLEELFFDNLIVFFKKEIGLMCHLVRFFFIFV